MACRVRDYRAAPSRRNRADSGALAAAPAVHSVAADGRLRVRSASRPLHSQSLSLVGTLSDSSSPSLEGDRVSLQLWGDIILEHSHFRFWTLLPNRPDSYTLKVCPLSPETRPRVGRHLEAQSSGDQFYDHLDHSSASRQRK